MTKTHSTFFYIFIAAVSCSAVIFLSIFSETSDILNGVGSDGIYYARFTPDIFELLKHKALMSQVVDRLIPLTIAHLLYEGFFRASDAMTIFEIDGNKLSLSKNVVQVYTILNACYLILSILIWSRINYIKGTSKQLFFLSLALLLCNFMFLKQFFFEPVFIDQFVFLYAMLLLYAVLFERKRLLIILLISSFFINKLAAVVTILIILFNDKPTNSFELRFKRNHLLFLWVIVYLSISAYLIYDPLCTELSENKTMYNLMALSMVAAVAFTSYYWLRAIPKTVQLYISKNLSYFFAMVIGMALYTLVVNVFAIDENIPLCGDQGTLEQTFLNEVLNFIRQANSRPLGFLSSHYNYFGLIILIMIFFVSRIRSFLEDNPGWILVFMCFLVASHSAESRYLTFFLPFLTWMLIAAPIDYDKKIFNSKWFLAVVCVVNLIWSGFYRIINPLGTELYYSSEDVIIENLFVEPLQNYFKHLGTVTSNGSYQVQLAIFIASLILGYLFILFLRKMLSENKANSIIAKP